MKPTQSIYDAYISSGYNGYQNGGFKAENDDGGAMWYEYTLIARMNNEKLKLEGVDNNLSTRKVSSARDGFIPKPKDS